ncbi:MAG: T9SS type A sorting domain-containing protein [Bacteroidia bacterium]
MKKALLLLACSSLYQIAFSQTVLKADGPGDTYELISSVLAPGQNPIEVPDCGHTGFGRHIDEVFDADLNAHAFRFYIHTHLDDDRCRTFDRQRNEIKTYSQSPDSLLGVKNETVQYRWKFKLPTGFQPSSSFTHLHQIKAVGGSQSSMPQITLTARKATPNRLELRYAENLSQTTLTQVELAPFLGNWVEATETITYGEKGVGKFAIIVTRISNNDTLLQYASDDIRMWKTNATFQRPKWGIYRSLNDSTSLRDETVLFADISIEELDGSTVSLPQEDLGVYGFPVYPNPTKDVLVLADWVMERCDHIAISTLDGKVVLSEQITANKVAVTHLDAGVYMLEVASRGGLRKVVKVVVE